MKKQEQINMLQLRIERIENELGLKHPDYFAMPLKSNLSEKPNSCDHYIPQPGEAKDYTHLLPDGYEFCTEGEHTHWVKVELKGMVNEEKLGNVQIVVHPDYINLYRPIRKIQYHVQVHEVVTAEPNPYAVDWANAPEWADVHCFDKDRKGFWHGVEIHTTEWCNFRSSLSPFTLPTGLDWTKSKTVRPR